MELGLKGRAAVITGGSKGIGRAIARGLAAKGVNLVLLARHREQLEKAADEIGKESGVQVLAVNISGVAATLIFGTALTHGLENAAMNQVRP